VQTVARPLSDLLGGLGHSHGAGRFRHVVFADALRRARAADFNPIAARRPAEPRTHTGWPDDDAFLMWLLERCGLDGASYRLETLRRRLPSCLRALRVRSVFEARRLLHDKPELLGTALSGTIIGSTSFFRDLAVFASLRDDILPALAATAARPPLRVWSAGCSDGAELYSVAMLLAERGALEDSLLLGTDCRADAIRQARAAEFDALALRDLEPRLRVRYFRCAGVRWQLQDRLRRAVHWRVGNMLAVAEPGLWDLILCRNVAIYLQEDAVTALWARIETSLRPGGILVLGKAERPHGTSGLSLMKPCIYRRRAL
jgi:chemotaxis protein methyltransferase CheR